MQETEAFITTLVGAKTIHAKIDRLAGVVTFTSAVEPAERLNTWAHAIKYAGTYSFYIGVVYERWVTGCRDLMSAVDTTTHLINKERMVHKV